MTQEKIKYRDIMNLGFKEKIIKDEVYEDEFGYSYSIISKKLTKKIHLDWEKETQLCNLIRINNPDSGKILSVMPINNLKHLKEIINFFIDTSY